MKTILTGIQPTGSLTLGNYIGAIKPFLELQKLEDVQIFVFIADLHALTVPQDPVELRRTVKMLAALYLAFGLDTSKANLFVQSEVSAHAELGYLLQTISYIGELERMTQYKDKKQKQTVGVSSALLTYPVLMAADILLYGTDLVPVGKDQTQHLELARNLAERFNARFSETFTVPEPFLAKAGAKIMSLQEPTKKMSKSDLNKASILILDDEPTIRKKIASAVTDSDGMIKYDVKNKPGVSNLLTILACCENKTIKAVEKELAGANYGTLKSRVSDAVVATLKPIQERYYALIDSPEIDEILDNGARNASYTANKILNKVKKKMGILRKKN